jgi:hypothetical protein
MLLRWWLIGPGPLCAGFGSRLHNLNVIIIIIVIPRPLGAAATTTTTANSSSSSSATTTTACDYFSNCIASFLDDLKVWRPCSITSSGTTGDSTTTTSTRCLS